MPETVILGAGIIGVSTAYYLSHTQPSPSRIHLIEASPELFSSASGFAGGFLAADWFAEDVSALGRLSFSEHARLAREFGGAERWGYRRGTAVSYSTARVEGGRRGDDWLREGTSRAGAAGGGRGDDDGEEGVPKWIARGEGDSVDVISEVGGTAQVYVHFELGLLLSSCYANSLIN
jgi:glycine/D-amino acid oxidase-like deaminating enzyme